MTKSLILSFFTEPQQFIQNASPAIWTDFLQQARDHGLSARFYYLLQRDNLLSQVPAKVRLHGLSAARYAEKQQHSLYFELRQLEHIFAEADHPCILLKGAAYRALALPVSHGRLFADIDILVPADKLKQVRDKLFFSGFAEGSISEYDRHYYINWSHQNPPLRHFQRGTVIDLHHHIYPTASAKRIDITPLFQQAQRLPGSAFSVPTITHMFLHAAVHLFYQEETHKLVKDIIDLNALLRAVEQQQLLAELITQAEQMSVQSALINAVSVLALLFNNTAAQTVLQQSAITPQRFVCKLLVSMLQGSALVSYGASALWFIRGHGMKMRWQILLYHSLAKPLANVRRWLQRQHTDTTIR